MVVQIHPLTSIARLVFTWILGGTTPLKEHMSVHRRMLSQAFQLLLTLALSDGGGGHSHQEELFGLCLSFINREQHDPELFETFALELANANEPLIPSFIHQIMSTLHTYSATVYASDKIARAVPCTFEGIGNNDAASTLDYLNKSSQSLLQTKFNNNSSLDSPQATSDPLANKKSSVVDITITGNKTTVTFESCIGLVNVSQLELDFALDKIVPIFVTLQAGHASFSMGTLYDSGPIAVDNASGKVVIVPSSSQLLAACFRLILDTPTNQTNTNKKDVAFFRRGDKVVRQEPWPYGSQDGMSTGTVEALSNACFQDGTQWVRVRWKNGQTNTYPPRFLTFPTTTSSSTVQQQSLVGGGTTPPTIGLVRFALLATPTTEPILTGPSTAKCETTLLSLLQCLVMKNVPSSPSMDSSTTSSHCKLLLDRMASENRVVACRSRAIATILAGKYSNYRDLLVTYALSRAHLFPCCALVADLTCSEPVRFFPIVMNELIRLLENPHADDMVSSCAIIGLCMALSIIMEHCTHGVQERDGEMVDLAPLLQPDQVTVICQAMLDSPMASRQETILVRMLCLLDRINPQAIVIVLAQCSSTTIVNNPLHKLGLLRLIAMCAPTSLSQYINAQQIATDAMQAVQVRDWNALKWAIQCLTDLMLVGGTRELVSTHEALLDALCACDHDNIMTNDTLRKTLDLYVAILVNGDENAQMAVARVIANHLVPGCSLALRLACIVARCHDRLAIMCWSLPLAISFLAEGKPPALWNPLSWEGRRAAAADRSFRLSHVHCGQSIEVSDGGLTALQIAVEKWGIVRGDKQCPSVGVSVWEARVDASVRGHVFFGVCLETANHASYLGSDQMGWGFIGNRGAWHNKHKQRLYGKDFRTGDVIRVALDMNAGTLSYALNGEDLGVAFEGLAGLVLYPAFSLYQKGDRITLLSSMLSSSSTTTQHVVPPPTLWQGGPTHHNGDIIMDDESDEDAFARLRLTRECPMFVCAKSRPAVGVFHELGISSVCLFEEGETTNHLAGMSYRVRSMDVNGTGVADTTTTTTKTVGDLLIDVKTTGRAASATTGNDVLNVQVVIDNDGVVVNREDGIRAFFL